MLLEVTNKIQPKNYGSMFSVFRANIERMMEEGYSL